MVYVLGKLRLLLEMLWENLEIQFLLELYLDLLEVLQHLMEEVLLKLLKM